ncbi:MAG: YARHG domain-containing protein [Lachnospiraceae bacterium]|nr:YARHG domain-containing protein [Lachnospiraceae bacterium]
MQRKNDAVIGILIVIIGMIIALAVALCVLVTVKFRIPALNAAAIEQPSAEGSVYEAVQVTNSYDAFSLGAAGQSSQPEDTQTPAAAEEPQDVTTGSEYLCDYSSDRQLTASDMVSLNAKSYGTFPGGRSLARMMINEIYARHGYRFQDAELLSYFSSKSWYTATTSEMSSVTSRMSSVEQSNIDFLEQYD